MKMMASPMRCRSGLTLMRTVNMARIVHNRLLGGWYVVRGPYQTPLSGRFASREEAKLWLEARRG
jgi:hypothetical protein